MAQATERWREREFWEETTQDGRTVWRATIAYDVVEADTEIAALSAVPPIGADHPQYGGLTVSARNPRKAGFNYWIVTETYSSDTGGGSVLNKTPRVRWTADLEQEEVDRDATGHPIVNSVGDPPDSPLVNDEVELSLQYRRWEPDFDIRKSLSTLGRVSSDDFRVRYGGKQFIVYAGECRCVEFQPAGEYDAVGSPQVEMLYGFKFRARVDVGGGKFASRFDWRIPDEGYQGRWLDGAANEVKTERLGDFYKKGTAPPERVSAPVRLDGAGLPLGKIGLSIKVTKAFKEPFGTAGPPPGAELDNRFKDNDPGAVFLIYQRRLRARFRNLIPLFL